MRHCVAIVGVGLVLTSVALLLPAKPTVADDNDDRTPRLVTQVVPEGAKWRASHDGRHLLAFADSEVVRVYDAATGRQIRAFRHRDPVIDAEFDPAGRWIGTVTASEAYDEHVDRFRYRFGVEIWDLRTGENAWRLDQEAVGFNVSADLSFSTTGSRVRFVVLGEELANGVDRSERILNPEDEWWKPEPAETFEPSAKSRFQPPKSLPTTNVLSPLSLRWSEPSRSLIAQNEDGTLVVWDTARGVESFRLRNVRKMSPDGRFVAVELTDGWELWDVLERRRVDRREGETVPRAISPDGHLVARIRDRELTISPRDGGRVLCRVEAGDAEFSGDGRRLVRWDRTSIDVIDVRSGAPLYHFEYEIPVPPPPYRPHYFESVAISPDGSHIGWGTYSGMADVRGIDRDDWSRPVSNMLEPIHTVAFSADGSRFFAAARLRAWVSTYPGERVADLSSRASEFKTAALAAGDGPVFAGSPRSGRIQTYVGASSYAAASLTSFRDGEWAVVGADGRFDASDLESMHGLHWLLPDDTMRPIPIEAFMRDYYEPRLLPRIIAGEKLPDVPDVTRLNLVSPTVTILGVEPSSARPGLARITLEVRSGEEASTGAGANDLRVFRDRRLVAWQDGPLALEGGKARIVREVQLWCEPGAAEIEFSAYAFNDDRVKSATARKRVQAPADTAPSDRATHVIVMGVDDFDQPRWNLSFAASDAGAMLAAIYGTDLPHIKALELISERRVRNGKMVRAVDSARKEDLCTALRIFAGEPVGRSARARLAYADGLMAARPQDLVVITISTHGVTSADGMFYLLPSDTAEVDAEGAWLASCISADELSRWLRPIDAEIVLVVDACQSAASVASEGFKPGPMGSRGLGQLAYSKRMRVLAASQASEVALESQTIRQGLLTYALAREGLGSERRADIEPEPGDIRLGEWLRYAVQRVPTLADEIYRGEVRAVSGRSPLRKPEERKPSVLIQTPKLFDFARRDTDVLLIGK